jgi:DNA-binding NtrC family response regulator
MARFLVVDDDHSTVSGMTRLLEGDGHDVASFTAGADALHALSRESFDAVVTDLEMPHVDGHTIVRATREHHPAACLIVVTDVAEENSGTLAEAGVCIVSDKPVDYEGITTAVTDCRARGGPSLSGRCHMRAGDPSELFTLRRK